MPTSLVVVVGLIIAGDVGAFRALIMPSFSRSHRSHLLAASAATSSSSSSTSHESVASQWMEEERRVEEEMDRSVAATATVVSSLSSSTATSTATNERVWEEMHGNYILRPPSSMSPPRAVIHFLGGAFLGAAPQLTYRYLLERLSSRGYLVVATPYQLSFDHLATCDEIISKFELVAPSLAKQYGAIPVVGVGHSCGALLHMLITSLFPDTPRAANALLSYNNRPVSEAIPVFEQLIVPAFSNEEVNGSKLIKAIIDIMRQQVNGEVPSDSTIQSLLQAAIPMNPLLSPLLSLLPQIDDDSSNSVTTTTIIPPSIREVLTNSIAQPTYKSLSTLPTLIAGLSLPELLNQTLDFVTQIPKLIDEVQCGARDFVPTPTAMSSAARRAYRCRRTLLLQFENDNLDDSILLEGYLREAESVMKMKRPMISINLERKVLAGNHLTPILGPSGGESWGSVLEESLGGLVNKVDGISSSSSSDGDSGGNNDNSSSSAKIVRERLGYEQVEKVVDALVEWLDEGSL